MSDQPTAQPTIEEEARTRYEKHRQGVIVNAVDESVIPPPWEDLEDFVQQIWRSAVRMMRDRDAKAADQKVKL